jgi:NADPH2:quinone reductase
VEIIIDPLGGDYFDAAIRALAWRGRLVVVGFAAGRIPTLKMNYPLLKNIEVSGIQISDYRKRMPDLVRACFEDVFALYCQGKITIRPATSYPLADYAKALDDLIHRRIPSRAILQP